MDYSENAQKVYEKLYLNGEENIDACHHRIASFLAVQDGEYEVFKQLLDDQIFRVNTPCMTNAGVKSNPNLCACFILDLEDSMASIIDMWGTCARIYEGGGGAGIPITNLRHKGAPISSGGKASGPLSYLETVQSISDQVKSGGRSRRAANLISYKYDHPDALEITKCKRNKTSFQAMNLSCLVNNKFMNNVIKPTQSSPLWDEILQSAWETGDPGLLFYDRINEDNPYAENGPDIVCSNPCGEVVGMPWTSCVLGHINLNKILTDDNIIDYELFDYYIRSGVLMLNRILDKTSHPHPEFKRVMDETRPIGIGIMGLADVLYKMQIPYGSPDAITLIETLTAKLTFSAFMQSHLLAVAGIINRIPLKEEQKAGFKQYLKRWIPTNELIDEMIDKGIGNSTVTCIAPTGSTSISADCSYGFEPHFAIVWEKQFDDDETWSFVNEEFKQACFLLDIELTEDLLTKIRRNKGSVKGIVEIPEFVQKIFVTAHDIDWKSRINMQAIAQENITMSISSTVNLPHTATKTDIDYIYKYAYTQGLKGITIYRDGCLDNQPVNFGCDDKTEPAPATNQNRPLIRNGKTVEVKTPSGKLYMTGNWWDDNLREVFLSMSNQDSTTNHLLNSIGRILSRSLQHGVPVTQLLDTMRGGGGEVFFLKLPEKPSVRVSGVVDAVAHIIDQEFADSTAIQTLNDEEIIIDNIHKRCPECGQYTLLMNHGCRGGQCINASCLYSNCK